MEPESSLPHSQVPATCPYPEPARSSPYPHTSHFLNIHLRLGLPSGLFTLGFPTETLYTSVQSTTGSRGVHISGSNAGYTMFRGSVKGTGYPLHSPVSPSLPLPCVTVYHHISTGLHKYVSWTLISLEIVISQTMTQLEIKQFARWVTYNNSHVHLPVKIILLIVNKSRVTNTSNLQKFKAPVLYN
jgi:hypothetical protein